MKELTILGCETTDFAELTKKINDVEPYGIVKLVGDFRFDEKETGVFLIGKNVFEHLVEINVPHLTLDGSNANISVSVENARNGLSLFFLSPKSCHTTFRNLNVEMHVHEMNAGRTIVAVYNTSNNLFVENCSITMDSDTSANLIAVYNNGNLDTHLDTRADNLIFTHNRIDIRCLPEANFRENFCVGFYNELANSVSLCDNYIFVQARGVGEAQTAIGIHNSGRFLRINNNNIKANGTHSKGIELEQATAIGIRNEGLYTLISDNNIVSEWAGTAISVQNDSEYMKCTGNKILATHTIKGRCIRNYGNKAILSGNILTSTSRNARMIDNIADHAIISENYMQVLMSKDDLESGVGISVRHSKNVILSRNIMLNMLNCGIYIERADVSVDGNICEFPEVSDYRAIAHETDVAIRRALEEDRIRTFVPNEEV